MSNILTRFIKGITLPSQSSDPAEVEEGSLYSVSNPSPRIKAYIQSATREVITNTQSQTLQNKLIIASENTIQVSATGVTAIELDAALEEIQSNIVAENSRAVAAENSLASQIGNISTTAANVGTGIGVFKEKLGSELKFKSLKAGSNVAITATGTDEVTISAAGAGGTFTETYPILNAQTNTLLETLTDKTKAYDLTYTVSRSALGETSRSLELLSNPIRGFNLTGNVNSLLVQPDGKILFSGTFKSYAGQTGKDCLIRLNSDYTEDTTFSTNAVVNGTTPKFFEEMNPSVRAVAINSSGKIFVGGYFLNYAGQTGKDCFMSLNADGTEDTAFSANAVVNGTTPRFNNNIESIAVQSDGKILVGGNFTNYSGQTGKNLLIRFNADGTEDTAFSANAVVNGTTARFSNIVRSIVVQSDGKILVGGAFQNYSGQTGKNFLIRFNADGTEDTTFSTNAVVSGTTARFSSTVNAIAVQSDGKILVGGNFTNYNATGKSRLIRLNSNGTEDTAFSTNAVVNGTTARFNSNTVDGIAVQSDGKIFVGGTFLDYGGQAGKSRLIRFNSDGTEDTTFSTNAVVNGTTARFNSFVTDFAFLPDGKIIIAGEFSAYNGSPVQRYAALINADGTAIGSLSFNSFILALAAQSDGKLLVGGQFTNYNGQTGKNSLIRLNADGTEDTAFSANAVVNVTTARFSSNINAIAIQSDGKILVGGQFLNYNATGKNNLIRLNADGTEDTTFSTNAVVNGTTARFSAAIQGITVQSDGKILVAGQFLNYSAQTGKSRLIRLNADGTEDTTFSTNAVVNGTTARFSSGSVQKTTVQSDGKILVVGSFTNYSLQTGKNFLIRFNADGTEDTTFSTNAVVNGTTARFSTGLTELAIQSDGKILVGGTFTNYSAQTGKNSLIRLNADGTEDTAFSANAVVDGTTPKFGNAVFDILVQSNGKIIISGFFLDYGGQAGKSRLIRFNSDGTEDTVFSTYNVVNGSIPRFTEAVRASVTLPSGRLALAGSFTNYSTSDFLPHFLILIQDGILRNQIGKLQAIPNNSNGFTYSTPTTLGPEAGFPTGVTISFNADGTIKYSSGILNAHNNSSNVIDVIKIDKKLY